MSSTHYSQPWKNAKNMSEGKSIIITKRKKTGLDDDWFWFKEAAGRSRKTSKKAYNNFISSSVASNNKVIQNDF